MSDYLRPEYMPLFTQVQDFIADQLNADPQLSSLGIEFLPEHRLDIEYGIKSNLGKQGIVGIVNTLKGTYGGHDGSTNAWEIEAEVDVLENPPVRRAQMKKMGLSAGTTADIINWVQESLCAPSSPTYGKFCALTQEMGEDSGIIVGKSIMKTFAVADISAVISGEHHWVCPYALQSDLSALSVQVADITANIHGDYIETIDGTKRIYANRDFTDKSNEYGPWTMTGVLGTTDLVLEYDPTTREWVGEIPEGYKFYLFWSTTAQLWEWSREEWMEDHWEYSGAGTYEATQDATEITLDGYTTTRQPPVSNGVLALVSDIPTKTSELTNDSGFITASQVPTPSYIQDADGNRIAADLKARRLIQHHVWYVTDTSPGGESSSLQPFDSFLSAEGYPEEPVEGNHGFKIELSQTGENDYAGVLTDYVYLQGEWVENEAFEFDLLNGATSATCDQYLIEYALTGQILTDATLATLDDLPTKTSDLTNDSGFITSAEIEPYHEITAPTVNTGIAKQAMSIALHDNLTNLKPNSSLGAKVKTNTDLTDEFTAVMGYATYYPYNLEKYFEQTFSPALELKFCEGRIGYLVGSRPRIIYTGYMFRTGGAGFAMPCSEDGTPDGRLYETTNVTNTAVIIADQTTSLHQLTFTARWSDPYGNVVAIDGQSGQMTCWRTNALKMYSISEELANKSDLPTKTSDLTNDSGFITSAQVPTPDKIEDLSANVIYANRTVQYIEEVANWTDIHYPNDPLNWDAENNWWIANISPSFYMKLQYNSGTWTLEFNENIGGEWVVDSGTVQDTQDATTLFFTVSGAEHTLTKGVQQIQTTGELALKSYVDGIVGDINSVLDAINGEEI